MNDPRRLAPGKYKLTVADFLRLDETGAFAGRRTELLGGEIIVMNAEYRPHAWAKGELLYRLRRALEAIESDLYALDASVHASEVDMPLPDIVLTREPRGKGAVPLASIALLGEVSSSTLRRDLGRKRRLYAAAGVPEYWVVDVNGRAIYQFWSPANGDYGQRREIAFGERIAAATIPELEVGTDEL